MLQKCVHKGCGQKFTDPKDPPCVYHPGGPIFHEGQKGWRCCKPRVLTFDEFLSIPPCTTGEHSATEEVPTHTPEKSAAAAGAEEKPEVEAEKPAPRVPLRERENVAVSAPVEPAKKKVQDEEVVDDEDEDDLGAAVKEGTTCRRRGCGTSYSSGTTPRSEAQESCVYHPGHPLFHEGSKGWTCCKRRVLEFDEFLKIEGCHTKPRHVFLESSSAAAAAAAKKAAATTESVDSVRSDFYQTSSSVIASVYLKKIDASQSSIVFNAPATIEFNLVTQDGKHYASTMQLYADTVPEENKFKIMGTKVELTLKKADGAEGWPVLRSGEAHSGQIIQSGNAGVAT